MQGNVEEGRAASMRRKDPAAVARAIVRRINDELIEKARTELARIDVERREADRTLEQRIRSLDAEDTAVGGASKNAKAWLDELGTQHCIVDTSVSVETAKGLSNKFAEEFDLVGVANAWKFYADIPRKSAYDAFSGRRETGLKIAGVGFGLFVVGSLFTNGIGPFKALCLGATAIGVGVVFDNMFKIEKQRTHIRSAFASAAALLREALANLLVREGRLRSALQASRDEARSVQQSRLAELENEEAVLRADYSARVRTANDAISRFHDLGGATVMGLGAPAWSEWSPAETPLDCLRVGMLAPPTAELEVRLRPAEHLAPISALLPFAPGRGALFVSSGTAKARQAAAVQSIAARLVAGVPPGKLRFTFIDPIGLGQNVAPLLALGDYHDDLVGGRSWSEQSHIEQRLAELTQHMETVIQKYLRDEHKTIEHYNANAGHVVEAYRVVAVCDFPANFTETSARRLVSIAQNGPRCGVYPLIIADTSRSMPYGVSLEELRPHLANVDERDGDFSVIDPDLASWRLTLDEAPPAELTQRFVKGHGELAEAGMRVSAPFSDLAAHAGLASERWEEKTALTSDQLTVPLGPSGARRFQELVFGRGTAHHALIVGQTGSGKSNLLHVLITTLALKYAPDELELYLIDFKQGVEFKLYADVSLPHARVIAIQSEREFGLSVLRGLLAEMNRRGDLFRDAGVPGLTDWRNRTGQKLPRILLLVDEFRIFFTVDDQLSSEATMIIDRLVSQGRAFGIHIVLASQTLAGSFALPRSISDQMAVRIVLQCTEADSRLALADDNPDARLLSRPGEAIYNDQRGLIEGNHRFQVADMGDDEAREATLARLLAPRVAAWRGPVRRPVVFEGHRPAKAEECLPLAAAFAAPDWPQAVRFADVWLGEPIALRPPVAVRLLRQSGANLLIVLRDESQAVMLIQMALLSLAAQFSPAKGAFHVVDMSSADGPFAGSLAQLTKALPQAGRILSRREFARTLEQLSRQLDQRIELDTPVDETIFLVLAGIHRVRELREEETASWSEPDGSADLRRMFAKLLREGPEVGIHIVAWADSQSSAARVLDRRMADEFCRRIVGPMSEQDSVALIDGGQAARLDKPHRLISFDADRPGEIEVFRPYAVTSNDWFLASASRLSSRTGASGEARGGVGS
ncbi:MAG TPA: FtsK/SpoIIIE domain-containing protein [Bradyrhizobium sp.]|jgi:S-DNA-T family DNA segregation ATPase FtsK/SpoIIIE|uniref:FtsK/SpoIIIE domain-containing protein n=1 Tax=Bradyrhizobium sp. TaxID=376 RepID=UPI002C9C4E73|nr:FtsK/SpoIIIE domain-containing protein [Bradyrhizobium sp.]HTB02446.1 FtsK/SpoIIIE domain-containing protein [Bradyrhizobium sp.]